ncbi:MAG: Rnase Y domain-containing protein, partial [Aureliella sp.]
MAITQLTSALEAMHSIASSESLIADLLLAQQQSSGGSPLMAILIGLIGLAAGAGIIKAIDMARGRDAKSRSQQVLEKAQTDANNLLRSAELEVKEKALQQKQQHEAELAKAREQIRTRELSLDRREETIQQAADDVRKQEKMVEANQRRAAEKVQEATRRSEELQKTLQEQAAVLQRLSGLSKEEATNRLLTLLDQELEQEIGNKILKHERRLSDMADQKAQEILLTAMQRYAAAHTADSTTSTVDIPNDDMKGRIIGRE